jgi:hypothetical protein
MKYIFLDIDGVLWTHRHMQNIKDCWKEQNINRTKELDPICVKYLLELLEDTGAMIVISSSWKMGRSVLDLKVEFERYGLDKYIIDKTRVLYDKEGNEVKRGLEIDNFLKVNNLLTVNSKYKAESFVIIDDDSDMVHLMPYLVKTNMDVGLNKEHIIMAKKILNS